MVPDFVPIFGMLEYTAVLVIFAFFAVAFGFPHQALVCMLAVPYVTTSSGLALVLVFGVASILLGRAFHSSK